MAEKPEQRGQRAMLAATPSNERDLVALLTRQRITNVVTHFAEATGVASGMVLWNHELADLAGRDIATLAPDLGKQYEYLRLTEVVNERPLCKALRATPVGNTHCFFSDGRYCREAHRRGIPIAYRCHAGLVDVVCPVYVGTYHEANVYGGQIALLGPHAGGDLRQSQELAPYVTEQTEQIPRCLPIVREATDVVPILCSCSQGIAAQTLNELAQQAIQKEPRDVARCIRLLQDIAELLSSEATDVARRRILDAAEEGMSEIAAVEDGIAKYLEAAAKLVSFKRALVIFYDREHGAWKAVPHNVSPAHAEALGHESVAKAIAEAADDLARVDQVVAEQIRPILGDAGCDYFDCVPMRVAGRCVGAWVAGLEAPRSLRGKARSLLLMFASRAGLFIESSGEINTLTVVQRKVASMAIHPDEEELPQAVTEGAKRLYGLTGPVGLWILDYASGNFDHFDLPGDPFNGTPSLPMTGPDGQPASLSGQAIIEQRAVWEQDIASSKRHYFPKIAQEHGLRAVLSVPLFADRRAVGVLNLHQTQAVEPNIHEKAILEAYGRSVAHAVQTWQLNQVNQQLDSCQCLQDVERRLAKDAARLTGARLGCVWLYRERLATHVLGTVWGADRDDFERKRPRDHSFTIRQIRDKREPCFVCDAETLGASEVIRQRHPEIRAWVALPLQLGMTQEGMPPKYVGVLYLDFLEKKRPDWAAAEGLFLGCYAGHLATGLNRILGEKDLRSTGVLARDDLRAAAARYAYATHLATIDEVAYGLKKDRPNEAKRLHLCVGAIRHGAEWQQEDAALLQPVALPLRATVEQRWEEAVKISSKQYPQPQYEAAKSRTTGAWPVTDMDWPQAYLVRVLDAVFVNTIVAMDHAIDTRQIRLDQVEIHIFAYEWEHDIQLTVWCNCAPFRQEDLVDLERDQLPKGPRNWGGGLRVAVAILHRSGGTLKATNSNGALLKLVIPKRWSDIG